MCPRYSRSPCGILNLSGPQYFVANSVVQELRGHQIHGPASEERGELVLETNETQSRHVSGLELDEHVDVALGPEILPQDGAEQGQPADVIAPAELGELVLRYGGLHRTSELEQRVEGRAGVARRGLVAVLGELLGQLGGEEEALVAVPLLGDARRDLLVL